MHPEVAAFLSFLDPYIRSEEERAAYSEQANARRRANIASAEEGDEVSAIQRSAEWGGCLKFAERGYAKAARRLAELCELGDDCTGARPWWRYAAALGDPAAQAYVQHILGESPSPAPVPLRAYAFCRDEQERASFTDPHVAARRVAALVEQEEARGQRGEFVAELPRMMVDAQFGDAAAARRVAELFELGDDMVGSRPWWRYAASLGDRDARDYVERIFGESAPAAAAEVADASGAADNVGEG